MVIYVRNAKDVDQRFVTCADCHCTRMVLVDFSMTEFSMLESEALDSLVEQMRILSKNVEKISGPIEVVEESDEEDDEDEGPGPVLLN